MCAEYVYESYRGFDIYQLIATGHFYFYQNGALVGDTIDLEALHKMIDNIIAQGQQPTPAPAPTGFTPVMTYRGFVILSAVIGGVISYQVQGLDGTFNSLLDAKRAVDEYIAGSVIPPEPTPVEPTPTPVEPTPTPEQPTPTPSEPLYETYKGFNVYQDPATFRFYFYHNGARAGDSIDLESIHLQIDNIVAQGQQPTPAPTPTPAPGGGAPGTGLPSGGGLPTVPSGAAITTVVSGLPWYASWLEPVLTFIGSLTKALSDQIFIPIGNVFADIGTKAGEISDGLKDQVAHAITQNNILANIGADIAKAVSDQIVPMVQNSVGEAMKTSLMGVNDGLSHSSPEKQGIDSKTFVFAIESNKSIVDPALSAVAKFPETNEENALNVVRLLYDVLLVAKVGLFAAGLATETLTLGQVESVTEYFKTVANSPLMTEAERVALVEPLQKGIFELARRQLNAEYTPTLPSTSELTTMRKRGFITDEVFIRTLAYQGYSKEWARLLLDERSGDPNLGLITSLYASGLLPVDQLSPLIDRLGYDPKYKDLVYSHIVTAQEQPFKRRYIMALSQGYSRGVIPADEVTTLTVGAGWTKETASWIMKAADMRKKINESLYIRPKLVSVGELKQLYQNDKITEDQLRTELTLRKYQLDQIEILIDSLNLSKSTEIAGQRKIALSVTDWLKAWKKDVITEEYLRIQLTLRGLPIDQQDILINTNKPSEEAGA